MFTAEARFNVFDSLLGKKNKKLKRMDGTIIAVVSVDAKLVALLLCQYTHETSKTYDVTIKITSSRVIGGSTVPAEVVEASAPDQKHKIERVQ